MSNPYFSNDPYFGESEKARKQRASLGVPAVPQAGGRQAPGQPYGAAAYGSAPSGTQTMPGPYASDRLEQSYQLPAAGAHQTGRLTYDDVIMKTAVVLGTIIMFGAVNWFVPAAIGMPELQMPLTIVGALGGFVLAMVNIFKRKTSPGLVLAYAALQGLFMGGISFIFEAQWSGIVLQALLATVATFTAVLLLFKSGKVRNSPKFQKIVMTALVGYMIFSLINLVLTWTGVLSGWGLREGPIGVLIGVAAVVLAAATLVIDFDGIQKGVQRGAPASYAWQAAFGLAVTLVWMYLEFLRLLAILRGD